MRNLGVSRKLERAESDILRTSPNRLDQPLLDVKLVYAAADVAGGWVSNPGPGLKV